jgi:hypothetical protein
MTDQSPNPNPNPTQPEYHDWREQRHAERMARHEARWQRHAGRPYGWFIGSILILLGIIFLLENMGIQTFANWWALLILIPAFWAFVAAWNIYTDNDRITAGVISSLTIGIVLTILSGISLFNLSLGQYWPILLIIGGLLLLITAVFPR